MPFSDEEEGSAAKPTNTNPQPSSVFLIFLLHTEISGWEEGREGSGSVDRRHRRDGTESLRQEQRMGPCSVVQ